MLSFIKNITNKLLKTKPDFWTTRLPWVLIIATLVHVFLGAVIALAEHDIRFDTQYDIWVSFIVIIILLALVFYLIFLLRFNVFKRFGKLTRFHYVGTFLAFLLSMALLISWGYNPSATTAIVARAKYDDAQIAKDINRINVLINTLEYDSIPHLWTRQLVVLEPDSRKVSYDNQDDYEYENYDVAIAVEEAVDAATDDEFKTYPLKIENNYYVDNHTAHYDSLRFKNTLLVDSTQQINDTAYYRFYCADYEHVTNRHEFFEHTKIAKLNREDLYYSVIKTAPVVSNRNKLDTELRDLIKKYWALDHGYYHNQNGDKTLKLPHQFEAYIVRKYRLYDLEEGISNISNSYYMWDWNKLGFFAYPLYYLSMILALILFLFRHNRKKSFFYTLLAGVLLFIFSVTIMAITRSGESFVLGLLVFYLVLFGIVAFSIFGASRKTLVQDIGMNLFIFFTPIIPLLFTALYYHIKKINFRAKHLSSDPDYSALYADAFHFEDTAIVLSQIIGFFFFLALLHFVYSKLLRKSYALPEN